MSINNNDTIWSVLEFHNSTGRHKEKTPTIPPVDNWKLRIALLKEEIKELEQAYSDGDIVEVADAFADIKYVLEGGVIEAGMIHYERALFEEVHKSNMSKLVDKDDSEIQEGLTGFEWVKNFGSGYLVDKNGKVRKPTFFEPPNINKVLRSNI
jgi:predicted HAD superfamily Cof-like phosphohydrolase